MSVLGRDVSNYDGRLSADTIRSWNVEHLVIRVPLTWENNYRDMLDTARTQVRAALEAGGSVSGYTWMYATEDPIDTARLTGVFWQDLGAVPTMAWVDCEAQQWVLAPAQNVDWLQTCRQALREAGLRYGTYTGRWWWVPYMGNSHEFADDPLWTAEYDGVPDLNVWTKYGGWDVIQGKQYWGSPHDLDVFDESVVGGGDGPEEDVGQIEALINKLGFIQGDVADALQRGVDGARKAKTLKGQKAALDAIQAAVNTLREV